MISIFADHLFHLETNDSHFQLHEIGVSVPFYQLLLCCKNEIVSDNDE